MTEVIPVCWLLSRSALPELRSDNERGLPEPSVSGIVPVTFNVPSVEFLVPVRVAPAAHVEPLNGLLLPPIVTV